MSVGGGGLSEEGAKEVVEEKTKDSWVLIGKCRGECDVRNW